MKRLSFLLLDANVVIRDFLVNRERFLKALLSDHEDNSG